MWLWLRLWSRLWLALGFRVEVGTRVVVMVEVGIVLKVVG